MFGGLVSIFNGAPDWVLCAVFFIAMLAVCELGFYLHRRSLARHAESDDEGQEAHVLAAALGLLALMIAFTFSMAQGRYDERRALIADEANAMVTAYLMVQFAPEPQRDRLETLMRRYADIRLTYFESDGDPEKLKVHDRESRALHIAMWDEMLAIVRPLRNTTLAGLIAEPMARLIELQEERRSARLARVPDEVLGALIVYSLITAYTLGYIMGGLRARHRIVSTILFALITVSILVTLDLDNPSGGAIRLSPEPLQSARETLNTKFTMPADAAPDLSPGALEG